MVEKIQFKRAKISKTKTLCTIAMILMMVASALLISMPAAYAHNPAWNIKTFAYITVAPPTVGVGQQMLVYMWLQVQPPTAEGAYGDRWQQYKVTVTKPDGTTKILGPFTSDPIGFSSTSFTPTAAGNYTFQFSFPGQTLAGLNRRPNSTTGQDFIGDYFMPSQSDIATLQVQLDPVLQYPNTPVPTGYWSRPINAQLRGWSSFSGNWLTAPINYFAQYTQAPGTAHVLWTKELATGGIVGGEFGDTSYYTGNAYEGKITGTIIINGKLYYNKYPDDTYALQEPTNTYPRTPPKPGFYCVDLRTGKMLWYNNDSRLSFGQIYHYDSPNQHGATAYLWAASVTNPTMYKVLDALTGDYVYTVTNVPAGGRGYSSDGSIVIPVLDVVHGWIALWNSSAIPELLGGPTGTQNWQWRPYGKTVDGSKGYSWNKTLPAGIIGGINYVFAGDRIIGSAGLGRTGMWLNLGTANFTIWSINLKSGQEGQLMWTRSYTSDEGATFSLAAASVQDGFFAIYASETKQWHGYDINTGDPLWTTTSQADWDMTVATVGMIAYGKLFSCGYAGTVYAYDGKTGNTLWTWAAKDPTYLESKWGGNYLLEMPMIADGKIYVFSGEHSPDNPPERGAPLACIDIATGKLLWEIPLYLSHWARNPALADGILVYLNAYDGQIYAFGKGQSATTVVAIPGVGNVVTIQGSVIDQSAGQTAMGVPAAGTPAISDDNMSAWMQYLYMQEPKPTNVKGVPVTVTVVDPNGNSQQIGNPTSDASGNFAIEYTPSIAGMYTITATFAGSNSYYDSTAETHIAVASALPSASAIPTAPPTTAPPPPTVTPTPVTPSPAVINPTGGPDIVTYVALVAVVTIAIIAAVAVILRRRK